MSEELQATQDALTEQIVKLLEGTDARTVTLPIMMGALASVFHGAAIALMDLTKIYKGDLRVEHHRENIVKLLEETRNDVINYKASATTPARELVG